MGIFLVRRMKLTQEIVDWGDSFGAGLFLRDGAALGMDVLEEKSSCRDQWLGRC